MRLYTKSFPIGRRQLHGNIGIDRQTHSHSLREPKSKLRLHAELLGRVLEDHGSKRSVLGNGSLLLIIPTSKIAVLASLFGVHMDCHIWQARKGTLEILVCPVFCQNTLEGGSE